MRRPETDECQTRCVRCGVWVLDDDMPANEVCTRCAAKPVASGIHVTQRDATATAASVTVAEPTNP